MKKYKFLRLKYIIPSLLLIALIIVTIVFFSKGLEKTVLAFDNIEFSEDDFWDLSTISKEEEKTLNDKKLVAYNKDYVMFIDEKTTIVSLYKRGAGWDKNNPTQNITLLYSSAQANGETEAKSNVVLEYYNSNGKTTSLTSFNKSVQYLNITTGDNKRYYKLRYNDDESIDIYYSIGDFSPIVIPEQFNRDTFNDIFIGNTVFFMQSDSEINSFAKIYDAENPDTLTDTVGVEVKYKGTGYCFDNEAALYLLKNGLATISYRLNSGFEDLDGYQFNDSNVSAEDEEKIKSISGGFWRIANVLDENGLLKAKAGVDYNTEVGADGALLSPVTTNPYLNQNMIIAITSSNSYEPRNLNEDGSVAGQPQWYQTNDGTSYSRILKFKGSESSGIKQSIYKYLYVGSFTQELISGSEEDGTAKYDYEYSENVYSTVSGIGQYNKQVAYFDWNQDGKITSDEKYQYGGYQLRDEAGSYVYYEDEYGNVLPKQMGFLTEDAVAQNDEFGVDSVSATVAFDVCLRFSLTSSGMDVTIINASIHEGMGAENDDPEVPTYLKHDNVISKIQVCKYMTVCDNPEAVGEIVLPDGSGSIIEFNSDKSQQYAAIYPEKRIYGNDGAINQMERGNQSEKIMLAMYGFLNRTDATNVGVVAIVKDGAAQTSISADYLRDSAKGGLNKYNYAYFTTYYRDSEKVKITSTTEYTKISQDFYQGDVCYSYRILNGESLSYVDVANTYRAYLIEERYPELEFKSDDTTIATPTFTFLGAYVKKTFKAGFVFDGEYSMTTFSQAKDIVSELNENGVENMNVMYRSWTEDENNQETTKKVKVSNEVGGKNGLIQLSNYLKSMGFNFYPEYRLTNGQGYDLAFGNIKYNSKSISGSYSNSISYVLSTGLENTERGKGSFLSPIYYNSLATKFYNNYKKLNISGIYLIDLGNRSISDYSKQVQVYSAGSSLYQRDALAVFKGVDNDDYSSFYEPTGSLIMLREPYDYAFSYIDTATCVPVQTSLYGSVNYSIPLYQLVVSGLFDYTSNPVNYNNDYSISWNILKAIETGSNLAYVLTAEDTNALLETQYTDYYNAYYPNWKENIIYMNNILNASGIYESRLVSHKYITDNVVEVEYENGLKIVINYENDIYKYDAGTAKNKDSDLDGYSFRNNWFTVIKEGA